MADPHLTAPAPVASDEYQGAPGRTHQTTIHYSCVSCGFLYTARVHTAVNLSSDPDAGRRLLQGELNVLVCPGCNAAAHPSVPLVYHDPAGRRFLLVIPDALRHQELQLRVALLNELAGDEAHLPDYVRPAEAVFGVAGLRRALQRPQPGDGSPRPGPEEEARREEDEHRRAALDQREEELLAREEDLAARQEDLLTAQGRFEEERRAIDQGWADLEAEREALRALSLDLEARERALRQRQATPPPLPPPRPEPATPVIAADPERPQLEIDRWRAGDQKSAHLLHHGQVFLLARPAPELLPALQEAAPTLLVQYRSLAGGPLAVLCATLPREGEPSAEAAFWFLDPAVAADRDLLQGLGQSFRAQLEIYDEEARLSKVWELQAPLEENVRWALQRSQAQPAAERDLAAARQAFEELGPERLGRKQHNFSADSFQDLASPASTRLALGIVAYWSLPENQDYLVGVKSFPLIYWRAIRERVVRRAVEYGLHLSKELREVALELGLAESWPALLRALLSSFAEVSLRIKPSDLEPGQDWENWKLLLAGCVRAQVPVDKEFEDLAAAAARRAGGQEDEAAPGGDLGLLSEEALRELLGNREQRRDAALELCERGEASLLEPIFTATCAMTRSEVSRVMPALVSFGQPVVPLLVQGLKHRKSFVRQGCALALGTLKARSAVEPLVDMLLSEPTPIWKEAARAMGDLGAQGLGALVAGARTADLAARERVAWSMAQATLHGSGRSEVEAMAAGNDAALARVARRALELVEQVRQADQEVRGSRPLREQTMVRSFSRQFFEGVTTPVNELGEGDILEQEEVLDDHDIVDEEVEVEDEDILNR